MYRFLPFEPLVYVINLEDKVDRYKFIETMIPSSSLNRVVAVDGRNGKSLNQELFERTRTPIVKTLQFPQLSQTEKACCLSHFKVWNLILSSLSLNDHKYSVILEDDVVCKLKGSSIDKLFREVIRKVPTDFDVCFLNFDDVRTDSYEKTIDIDSVEIVKITEKIQSLEKSLCSHAYIITRQGCEKLFKASKEYHFQEPLDWFLRYSYQYLNLYKCSENLFEQTSTFPSDITHLQGYYQFN